MWKTIVLDVECIVCNKTLQKINHDPREISREMGKITNRRSRTPNWSLQEKQHLLELIRERKEVVVTKSNNGPNYSEEKDVAWNAILRELAIKFGDKFIGSSTKKVKTQWQNMKRIAREEIALNGPELHKYTNLSLEVCEILELLKDGVLKNVSDHDSTLTTDVEIKAERIEEENIQPECINFNNSSTDMDVQVVNENNLNPLNQFEVTGSSSSDNNDLNDLVIDESRLCNEEKLIEVKHTASMTDISMQDLTFLNLNKEYFKYTAEEKALKIESLKEERQVVRAMRETAELNKITAEQRLKHVLWVKKQEMSMYSGEPGSGAGKGGGGGGAIREAGGAFGKMEAAREDEYFYKKQKEQLANLKGHLNKEIAFHQEQIKRHEDAIRRHKEQMAEVKE
ncbi:uncharacterized protein LOC134647329 [Cydia amplana]|uniref:uncharacterized protein LOC134647329 n=2 Tax=Cydia TaxID=82599 RepID=UPI002FE5017E